MQFVAILIAVFVAVAAFALFSLLGFLFKGWHSVRKILNRDYTDEEFERLSNKNYRKRDADYFAKDYFSSSGNKSQRPAGGGKATRSTQASEGVTIVDNRDTTGKRPRIFDDDEGEYIDFKE